MSVIIVRISYIYVSQNSVERIYGVVGYITITLLQRVTNCTNPLLLVADSCCIISRIALQALVTFSGCPVIDIA